MKSVHFFYILIFTVTFINCGGNGDIDSNEQNSNNVKLADPIVINEGETFSFDLNNDDVIDFVFSYTTIGTADIPQSARIVELVVDTINDNAIPEDGDKASPVEKGAVIDSSLNWSYYNAHLVSRNWSLDDGWDEEWSGHWSGINKEYLPLMISVNEFIYYGWANISIDKITGELTLYEYAFNPQQGEKITAGS